jgi:phenylalanyl-tRNA synthetase beta chain
VDIDVDANALAELLTTAGLEVDSVLPAAALCDGIVVARVVDRQPHPDADRLSVCTVDAGASRHQVVCGAPNAAAGICAPFAPVGATLPGGQRIKAAKLRGVASDGMLCSAKELGIAEDADGLLLLDGSSVPGTPLNAHLRLDDHVLDVDLTPNRGDCFSVLGIAREIAAKQGGELTGPRQAPVPPSAESTFAVAIENAGACPRFVGRVVRNLDLRRATPDWMRERLRRAGSRPIHPVVDVTNYVMLELGQPLHAYDLRKLSGSIVVRSARAGEKLTLLDGKEVTLSDNTLVIGDQSGAIGMAGIMGGASTAVDPSSADIFLEAAYFAPDAILGRARQYGLHTDASTRFERGVDPAQQERAIERATQLLIDIAGGMPGPLVAEESRRDIPVRNEVFLRHARIGALLGADLSRAEVEGYLHRLGMDVNAEGEGWTVVAPSYRFDIAIEEDLIEELGRIHGYDNVPIVPGAGAAQLGRASEHAVNEERVADVLVARGYNEIITYSFVDPAHAEAVNPGMSPVALANPISNDLAVMRRSLWPGLLLTAQQNLSRQQARLRLFEIGRQFIEEADKVCEINVLAGLAIGSRWPENWGSSDVEVDFYDVKADLEALLSLTGRMAEVSFEAAEHPALKPGQTARISFAAQAVGWLGVLHPQTQRVYELKTAPVMFALEMQSAFAAIVPAVRTYSKFPSVRRDLAFVVDEAVTVQALLDCVRAAAGENLQSVTVFDIYRGKGIETKRKSVALGLILQGAYRTLTDEDADETVQSVTWRLEHELGATIRT